MEQFRYAGFWQRVVGHLIDQVLIGAVQITLALPFIGLMGLGSLAVDVDMDSPEAILGLGLAFFMAMAIAFITQWLYYAFMESSSHQGTVGKIVLRIKVTDLNGGRITFGRSTGRFFARILSGLFFGLGFLMAAFTQQRQTLHDIIVGTLVLER